MTGAPILIMAGGMFPFCSKVTVKVGGGDPSGIKTSRDTLYTVWSPPLAQMEKCGFLALVSAMPTGESSPKISQSGERNPGPSIHPAQIPSTPLPLLSSACVGVAKIANKATPHMTSHPGRFKWVSRIILPRI